MSCLRGAALHEQGSDRGVTELGRKGLTRGSSKRKSEVLQEKVNVEHLCTNRFTFWRIVVGSSCWIFRSIQTVRSGLNFHIHCLGYEIGDTPAGAWTAYTKRLLCQARSLTVAQIQCSRQRVFARRGLARLSGEKQSATNSAERTRRQVRTRHAQRCRKIHGQQLSAAPLPRHAPSHLGPASAGNPK